MEEPERAVKTEDLEVGEESEPRCLGMVQRKKRRWNFRKKSLTGKTATEVVLNHHASGNCRSQLFWNGGSVKVIYARGFG